MSNTSASKSTLRQRRPPTRHRSPAASHFHGTDRRSANLRPAQRAPVTSRARPWHHHHHQQLRRPPRVRRVPPARTSRTASPRGPYLRRRVGLQRRAHTLERHGIEHSCLEAFRNLVGRVDDRRTRQGCWRSGRRFRRAASGARHHGQNACRQLDHSATSAGSFRRIAAPAGSDGTGPNVVPHRTDRSYLDRHVSTRPRPRLDGKPELRSLRKCGATVGPFATLKCSHVSMRRRQQPGVTW